MTPATFKTSIFALAVLWSLGSIAPLQAQEQPVPVWSATPAIEAKGFADHLFNQGEYYRAIGEYQRYLYLRPDAPDAEHVHLRSAMAYLFGGEYRLANDALARVNESITDPRRLRLAAFARCQASFLHGTWSPASVKLKTYLQDFPADKEGRPLTNQALLMAGWTSLRLNRLEDAETSFAVLAENSAPEKGYAKLVADVHALRTAPQTKSPWVAGLLSVVPGLGHAYLGRPDIALFALAWNSLFIYAAADNIRNGDYGTGSILSSFAFLWYSGTIYGSVSGAHKWNRDMRLNKIEALEESYPPDPGLDLTKSQLEADFAR
jgi:tetratricopeptide (TPR) repeat protein